jgi:hypothetical protein
MWMLVIILLNTVLGISTVTLLETYSTSQECHNERDRIGDEMAKAYPDEHDFEIACRLIKAKRKRTYTRTGTFGANKNKERMESPRKGY